jgi:hypothetical protein
MNVIFNGKILKNISIVHKNIKTKSKMGYTAIVVFGKNGPYAGYTHYYHNLNQIDINFELGDKIVLNERQRIAFESDNIHRSGCWRYVDEILTVVIFKSKSVADEITIVLENN